MHIAMVSSSLNVYQHGEVVGLVSQEQVDAALRLVGGCKTCPWHNSLHTTTRVAQCTRVYIHSSITPQKELVLVVVLCQESVVDSE
jgi:Fe-S cluster biogenesis protein NfuA